MNENILKDVTCLEKLNCYGNFKPKSDKCLVVGSSYETLKTINLEDYLRKFDGDIIVTGNMKRFIPNDLSNNVLRVSMQDWAECTKIGLKNFDASEDYSDIKIYKKYFTFTFLKYLNNSFVRQHVDKFPDIYNSFVRRHLTTGFCTVLFALYNYDICEICGFGFTDTKYENSRTPQYYYESTEDKKHTNGLQDHDFNLEHSFYDYWQVLLKDKFYRIEERMT